MITIVPWDVVDVSVEKYLKLHVRFIDKTTGYVSFSKTRLRGVFEVLKDPEFFNRVYLDNGVVTWPGELDLAPDAMYDEIKLNGVWILE